MSIHPTVKESPGGLEVQACHLMVNKVCPTLQDLKESEGNTLFKNFLQSPFFQLTLARRTEGICEMGLMSNWHSSDQVCVWGYMLVFWIDLSYWLKSVIIWCGKSHKAAVATVDWAFPELSNRHKSGRQTWIVTAWKKHDWNPEPCPANWKCYCCQERR